MNIVIQKYWLKKQNIYVFNSIKIQIIYGNMFLIKLFYLKCSFIEQLNVKEKLDWSQWFIETKNRPLFVFDFVKNQVFNQVDVDREQCQNLLRQFFWFAACFKKVF